MRLTTVLTVSRIFPLHPSIFHSIPVHFNYPTKKNMRNNFIENFWKGWSYIYIPFWRGPPRLSCWKKTWVKMSNLSPPQKNPLDETAGTYVCGPLPWRVPESTCQSWWKFPTGSRKGRTVYLYIYMKNHQNRRNVGTYASPMIPMGMIENSGVVGGGSERQLLNKRSVDLKSFSWVMEFLQVFPQHFSCRESKSDFWTIYSRDRAVIQHLRIQNFAKTSVCWRHPKTWTLKKKGIQQKTTKSNNQRLSNVSKLKPSNEARVNHHYTLEN